MLVCCCHAEPGEKLRNQTLGMTQHAKQRCWGGGGGLAGFEPPPPILNPRWPRPGYPHHSVVGLGSPMSHNGPSQGLLRVSLTGVRWAPNRRRDAFDFLPLTTELREYPPHKIVVNGRWLPANRRWLLVAPWRLMVGRIQGLTSPSFNASLREGDGFFLPKTGNNCCPPPPPSRAPSLRPATVSPTPSASLNGICNRQ